MFFSISHHFHRHTVSAIWGLRHIGSWISWSEQGRATGRSSPSTRRVRNLAIHPTRAPRRLPGTSGSSARSRWSPMASLRPKISRIRLISRRTGLTTRPSWTTRTASSIGRLSGSRDGIQIFITRSLQQRTSRGSTIMHSLLPSGRSSQEKSGGTGRPISGTGTRRPCIPMALSLRTGSSKKSFSSMSLIVSGERSKSTAARDISRSSGTSRSTLPMIVSMSGQTPVSSSWMNRRNRLSSQVSPLMPSARPDSSGETRSMTGMRTRSRDLHGGRAGSIAPYVSSTGCALTTSGVLCSTGRSRPMERPRRMGVGSTLLDGASSPCFPGAGRVSPSSLRISATSHRTSTR